MSEKVIKAYKGFNKDLTCRGFQYEIGKEYETEEVKVCEKGFHACESPLEVLDYYFLLDNAEIARFCEVEQSGTFDREENSTKVASSKIKIKAELKFADLIKVGVEWLKDLTSPEKVKASELNDNGRNHVRIGSSGYYTQIGSSGDDAQIGSSGSYVQIGSSGDDAKIGSSGNYAQIGSSGDNAKIGASGDSTRISSSGDNAKIGASGDCAKIGSSGYSAKISSTGDESVICCAGRDSIVKAKKGSWITLAEWRADTIKDRWAPKCVKTEYVDGERIKADTWYILRNGEFTELKNVLTDEGI